MAVTYPRTDIFIPGMYQSQEPPYVRVRQELSRTAGGQSYGKDLGPGVWVFSVTTRPLPNQEALRFETKIKSLNGVMRKFFAYDLRYRNPVGAATGAKVSAYTANTLTLKDAAPGYVVTEGDYFAYDYGTGKRAYHIFLEGATAEGSGDISALEIYPSFRPGSLAVDADIILENPKALVHLVPDSTNLSYVDQLHSTVSFQAEEA